MLRIKDFSDLLSPSTCLCDSNCKGRKERTKRKKSAVAGCFITSTGLMKVVDYEGKKVNQDYRAVKFTKRGSFLTSERNKENPGAIQKPCLVIQTYGRGGILLMQRLCGNSYGIIPSQVSISPALSVSIFYPSFSDCLLVCFLTQACIG